MESSKKLETNEIAELLKKQILDLEYTNHLQEVGEVIAVEDGIVKIFGLENVGAGEIIEFDSGFRALVVNLERDIVKAILIGDDTSIKQGEIVKRTGEVLKVPVGVPLLGRVVNSMGDPIDGRGDIKTEHYRSVEEVAPSIVDRKSVNQPVQTGIKVIDALIPIGRGQRELIIGDRQIGKTAIAIDTIINQKKAHIDNDENEKIYCVYVAIGQKRSTVAQVVKRLEDSGAMEYTVIVSATASDSVALQYIAPYTACAIGEYFRDNGMHALVVYDDLSKHAVAYRQISLLLRRSPGREAYPGDVFYLHSRLLERAAKLSDELGGGSLTALPIVETQAGDVSAYIPTNIISITDGQIFLESELFYQGVRPAVNIGLSVSRVGSAAQLDSIKRVSGNAKLDLAQFRELAAFSQFSSDLDSSTKKSLARGARLTELLKQDQYCPLPLEEQVVSLFVGVNGFLERVPVDRVQDFEKQFLLRMRSIGSEILFSIKECKAIVHETEVKLRLFLEEFIEDFLSLESK